MAPKGLVLVTGANGYIGARTVEAYLHAGYAVRGTVRSLASAAGLLDALSDFVDRKLLEMVRVPDIAVPGAFDAAVAGVTAIAHLASPLSFSDTNADYVVGTAVGGTLSILESAAKEAGLGAFVYMSSISAARAPRSAGVITEDDWSDAPDMLRETENPKGFLVYASSKVAAEKALWKWVGDHKPSFSVTALNPVFVAGPPLVLPPNAANGSIPETIRFIWQVFSGQEYPPADERLGHGRFVDVRDVARLAVFGVEHPEAADRQRYILSSGYGVPQAVADILRRAYPERRSVIREGTPGEGYLADFSELPDDVVRIRATKAVEATGQGWIPFGQTVLDTAGFLEPLLKTG